MFSRRLTSWENINGTDKDGQECTLGQERNCRKKVFKCDKKHKKKIVTDCLET